MGRREGSSRREDDKDSWPGLGDRIRQRMTERGYRSVEKFTQIHHESGYTLGLVYKWIRGDVTPSRQSLLKLAEDLDCSPAWLLFGSEMATPIGGGAGPAAAPPGVALLDALSLIGRWLRLFLLPAYPMLFSGWRRA